MLLSTSVYICLYIHIYRNMKRHIYIYIYHPWKPYLSSVIRGTPQLQCNPLLGILSRDPSFPSHAGFTFAVSLERDWKLTDDVGMLTVMLKPLQCEEYIIKVVVVAQE